MGFRVTIEAGLIFSNIRCSRIAMVPCTPDHILILLAPKSDGCGVLGLAIQRVRH